MYCLKQIDDDEQAEPIEERHCSHAVDLFSFIPILRHPISILSFALITRLKRGANTCLQMQAIEGHGPGNNDFL